MSTGERVILFIGDSDTRGYGVGRQERYAAVVQAALAEQGVKWRCQVALAPSFFYPSAALAHVQDSLADRIDSALAKYAHDIVVLQCPIGPAAYDIRYPAWIKRIAVVHNRVFRWWHERYIRADICAGGSERSRKEALYEGRYLDRVFRRRPSRWIGVRQFRRLLVARYGTNVKATRQRYVELASKTRDHLRSRTTVPIVFLGLFPVDDECYPGYTARAAEFNQHLAGTLHQAEAGFFFVDALRILDAGTRGVLLGDGVHLSIEGHRRVAALILPTLTKLTRDRVAAACG